MPGVVVPLEPRPFAIVDSIRESFDPTVVPLCFRFAECTDRRLPMLDSSCRIHFYLVVELQNIMLMIRGL